MALVKRNKKGVAQETPSKFVTPDEIGGLDPSLYPIDPKKFEATISVSEERIRAELPERDPIKELGVTFKRNPTVAGLMGISRTMKGVKIRVPKNSKHMRIKYEDIWLNGTKFEPGVTYELHPLLAQELNERIQAFENSLMRQTTGGSMMDPTIAREFDEQERAEQVRVMTSGMFED